MLYDVIFFGKMNLASVVPVSGLPLESRLPFQVPSSLMAYQTFRYMGTGRGIGVETYDVTGLYPTEVDVPLYELIQKLTLDWKENVPFEFSWFLCRNGTYPDFFGSVNIQNWQVLNNWTSGLVSSGRLPLMSPNAYLAAKLVGIVMTGNYVQLDENEELPVGEVTDPGTYLWTPVIGAPFVFSSNDGGSDIRLDMTWLDYSLCMKWGIKILCFQLNYEFGDDFPVTKWSSKNRRLSSVSLCLLDPRDLVP